MMESFIVLVVFAPLALYLFQKWLYNKKYPHQFNCKYCEVAGTTFKFAANEFSIMRQVQLDHLDKYHAGAL